MNFLANLRIADPMFVQHVQTPEGSLFDIIRNAYDLLSRCDIKIPKIEGKDKYVDSGPPYLIFFHPALGPLWEVTRQKLHGSLIVVAENILGSTRMDENGVEDRFEALKVILHGNAEFEATDVVFQTEDAKERALEKLSINVCGKQLLIFRIDAPRTTVVRISNLYSAEAKKKLFSICRSYGKVKVVGFRHKEIRDVHFMLSEWPNMLKILNRLNGLKVDDCRIIAQPALVFPPEVLRVLCSHSDERRRLETTIWMKTLLYTSMNFLANLRIADPMFVQHVHLEGSLLDIIRNAYDLLSHCDIKIPKIEGNDKYVDSGPPYLIFLHPALGPLWEVTRQKFHGGSISKGSELQIELISFLYFQLHGSLIVVAENILGSTRMDENGELKLRYRHRCGRCKLQNVKVLNEGIDWTSRNNTYWKHDVQRFEALKVILHGNAEFEATDVVFQVR
ncbi:hypothetical protein LOK49_LG08G00707 [Camellia lanceoleosa]|uniref:Uncharacterized protein n=1 Tax=Camellia lanceoleosa TaxID=1840588 RepID=A0ACC0GR40_9ERIC|nr:hypothetical protein LOK49_LG08G00707 [Camellia lanceoleosa]